MVSPGIATGSVIPLSGRRDGRVRLERHLRSALAELEPSGQLADLIRSTFSDALRLPV